MFNKLKDYFSKNYRESDTEFPEISIAEFKDSAKQLYDKIHKDCLRSLQYLRSIHPNISSRSIQSVFESFFIHILSLSPVKSSLYYQGLTDIFEVIFTCYVEVADINLVTSTDIEYIPLELSLSKFFSNVNYVLNIATQIMTQLYNQTHFDQKFFVQECHETTKLLQKNDKDLFNVMKKCELQPEILLKYQFSSGIRYSTSPYVTQELLICFLQYPDLRSFVQQQLISVCFRAYAPLLVPEDKKYNLNLMTQNMKQSTDKLELIMECLTNGYGEVFHLDSNAAILSEFFSKIKENKEKSITAKAVSMGIGIGMGLFGVIGGVVGGIIASVVEEKRKQQ
ncbi:hypothetical protein SS50377_23812 [Spironucleus salmonicida]|uniref:Uncharacterized protein n=1 Tax=Spironucleus salmonicida TaxID=348837 RepID=V6LS22_9EUKA|nr:hypothetical protein SS50377_23812 [Spironucleus salmonicida]|eukprot:EST46491.1 Hypothetical protein SS50377_13572 [Spironucleus salmonicida]